MNVLIVGSGKGSWTMRGLQLGAAIGARVVSSPTAADWSWATVVVLVKRAITHARQAHDAGVPIVWDALDFWAQPLENRIDETDARRRLAFVIAAAGPALVIGATQSMAKACGGAYLPHHSWAGLTPTPARDVVRTVAYEGNGIFLGAWRRHLEAACARRGLRFVVNPPDIREADILVALREAPNWDGWMCREWKSGVKLVNAIAAGRPVITQDTAAMREIGGPGTVIDHESQIDAALDAWASFASRDAAVAECHRLAPALCLEAIAERYTAILTEVRARCAA